ncbi:MAG: ParA family protein [bacterium]|nr:ParA family protein [bacterium]
MMITIAVCNQKGGCGKTTTSVNLSSCLASKGYKILLVDMDPQSHASLGVGIDIYKIERSMYNVLINQEIKLEEIICKTEVAGLDIAPATLSLSGVEIDLVNTIGREGVFKGCVNTLPPKYDFMIIDCPPSLSLLTVNALTAAQELLIPLQMQYYPMEGMKQLFKTVDIVTKRLNSNLNILGILPTLYDGRTNLCKDVLSGIKGYFKEKVFETIINDTIKLAEAPSAGKPINIYDAKSKGTEDYFKLTDEVLGRVRQKYGA